MTSLWRRLKGYRLLILAGVLWLASSATEQGKQLAAINVQIADLKTALADVPGQEYADLAATIRHELKGYE